MPWARRLRPHPPVEPAPHAGPEPAPSADEPPVQHVATPGRMRRELRLLARRRETEIRDVGGLTVEMVRRDRFRPELLLERAGDVLQIEQRLHELDAMLATSVAAARGPLRSIPRCVCGAPLPAGFHFCANCGRPAPGAPSVTACSHCGQPLPGDANFCAFCGNSAAHDEFAEESVDETMVRPWASGEERAGDG
jgi:hypothetical protein